MTVPARGEVDDSLGLDSGNHDVTPTIGHLVFNGRLACILIAGDTSPRQLREHAGVEVLRAV